MTAEEYIAKQKEDRRKLLADILTIILKEDNTVTADVGAIMNVEMILYKERRYFK